MKIIFTKGKILEIHLRSGKEINSLGMTIRELDDYFVTVSKDTDPAILYDVRISDIELIVSKEMKS